MAWLYGADEIVHDWLKKHPDLVTIALVLYVFFDFVTYGAVQVKRQEELKIEKRKRAK